MATKATPAAPAAMPAAPQADPPGPPEPPPSPAPSPHPTPPPKEPPGRTTPLAPLELLSLQMKAISCLEDTDALTELLVAQLNGNPEARAEAQATGDRLRKTIKQVLWCAGLPFTDMPS